VPAQLLAEWEGEGVRNVTLFSAVTAEQMRQVQVVTGVALAAFIGVSVVPGLHQHAGRIRLGLLVVYLLACGVLVGLQLLR